MRQFAMFSSLSPSCEGRWQGLFFAVCAHWPRLQSEHPGVLAAAWPIHVVRGFSHLRTGPPPALTLALPESQAPSALHG